MAENVLFIGGFEKKILIHRKQRGVKVELHFVVDSVKKDVPSWRNGLNILYSERFHKTATVYTIKPI